MNDAIKTQISAYVDGELPQNEAELLLRRLCQDRQLRQQAAEYLAVGRAMRGERSVAGISTLRDRVAAALDDTALLEELEAADPAGPRYLRPMVGVAIAATVALAALLGLQQMSAVPEADSAVAADTVAESVEDSYTVPDQTDDLLRDYYLSHSASSSYIGANSINPRIVTGQFGIGVDSEAIERLFDEDEVDLTEAPDAETP